MRAGFVVCSISKSYDGDNVLTDVSFSLPAGAHTAILGPSGCGKSTLLHVLAGLEVPSAGQVLLGGQVVSRPQTIVLPPHRRGVGMVFQDVALWPNLSVLDNVRLGLTGARIPKHEVQERAREALALCAIPSLADRHPGTLSGGEQQRVALARVLARQPAYVFLDEPFSGLDLVTKLQLLEEIATLANKQTFTLVLVTHDPVEAITLCQRALVLEKGHVEEVGMFADLLRTPHSDTLKAFRFHLRIEKDFLERKKK